MMISNLVEVAHDRAQQEGAKIAYTYLFDNEIDEASITYEALDRKAKAIAFQLQINCEDIIDKRAVLLFPPGIEFIEAFFGCLYAGVTAVPTYLPRTNYDFENVSNIINNSSSTSILTTSKLLPKLQAKLQNQANLNKLKWLSIDTINNSQGSRWEKPFLSEETIALLQYTSGSTGEPKGVIISHKNLMYNSEMIRLKFGHTAMSQGVIWLPPYHDMGLVGGIIQPMFTGFHVALMSPVSFLKKPVSWLRAITKYRATTSGGSNFSYDLCVQKIEDHQLRNVDLDSWSVAFTGAEPIKGETIERFAEKFRSCRFKRTSFYPCYGLAEATLMVTSHSNSAEVLTPRQCSKQAFEQGVIKAPEKNSESSITFISCGTVAYDGSVAVVDPATNTNLPDDRVGEIWVAGPGVAQGYYNNSTETQAAFGWELDGYRGKRFLRTGDLGFKYRDQLFITGRLNDLIIIRGRNFYPQDIESTVQKSNPAIKPGSAVAVQVTEEGADYLMILCELNRTYRYNDFKKIEDDIKEKVALSHGLEIHALIIVRVGEILLTSSGKVRRSACREAYLAGKMKVIWRSERSKKLISNKEVPTRHLNNHFDYTLMQLKQMVANSLNIEVENIDVNRPSSGYGIDSITAIELSNKISNRFNVDVSALDLLQGITIFQIATKALERPKFREADLPITQNDLKLDSSHPPLSFQQQRLWFLDQLEPGSSFYNIPAAVRFTGQLDAEVLERSFNEVIKRHEVLRTTFAVDKNGPAQVVASSLELSLGVIDLHDAAEPEVEVQRLAKEEAHKPFDLVEGPLLRATLLRLSDNEHILLITMHHIISDGWSMGVFTKELSALYNAFTQGEPSPLPDLPIQYVDYAVWQREQMQGEVLHSHLKYWKRQLEGSPPLLQLPTDHPRPARQTFEGAVERFTLDQELTQKLKELSRKQGVTLFMTLLAAFNVLLSRLSGQTDIVVGTPVANRNRSEIENLIGFFVNTLVLRTDLADNPSFEKLLERVKRTTLDAYTHQDLPFEKLVEELRPQRSLSYNPLFQIFINMIKLHENNFWSSNLPAEFISQHNTKFDMTLYVIDRHDHLNLELVYDVKIFGSERIKIICRQLISLLLQISEEPRTPMKALTLLDSVSKAAQPNPEEYLDDAKGNYIHSQFVVQAVSHPNSIAVEDKFVSWSYSDLHLRSNKLANYLQAHGVVQGLVAVYAHRSASLVWAILGILKAGAAFIILDPSQPPARLLSQIELCEPTGWIQIEAAGIPPKSLTDSSIVRGCRFRLELPSTDVERFSEINSSPAGNPENLSTPAQTAYVTFTSGSTGVPQGISGAHKPVSHFLCWCVNQFPFGKSDRFSMLSGLSHDPLLRDIFLPLSLGAKLIIPDSVDMRNLRQWLADSHITVIHATPSLLRIISDESIAINLPELRYVFSGGEPLTSKHIANFRNIAPVANYVNYYGATETPQAVSYHTIENPADLRQNMNFQIPIGKGIDDTQILVLDANDRLAGIGELGEICVRTPYLSNGYLNNQKATESRFIQNPFRSAKNDLVYRTGDLGHYLPDGNVVFANRIDHQIKINGHRVELAEIESTLNLNPSIKGVAVIRFSPTRLSEVNSEEWSSKQIIAFVVTRKESLSDQELRSYVSETLPSHMIPSAFIQLKQLPLTSNGKVDYRLLKEHYALNMQATRTAPRNSVEERIYLLWQKNLKEKDFGVYDNFFSIGGHSLLAVKVVSTIRSDFNIELSLQDFLIHPTVSSLAEIVSHAQRTTINLPISRVEREIRDVSVSREGDLQFTSYTKSNEALYKKQTEFQGVKFSLFFFAAARRNVSDKYKLLIECAKFADQHGFAAIWTPERHFESFGGLYPNPSVIGAALATITSEIQIRAGSVVLPLQNPLRIVEDWSIVDNLSNGRVAVAFASGWQINDFALAPQNYTDRKQIMFDGIKLVQKLWAGETVHLPNGEGVAVPIKIFPRPLQANLPTWITAQSKETFILAGKLGANVLTNLHYKHLDDLATRIKAYRSTLKNHGFDPEKGQVTLMIHTFLNDNDVFAKSLAKRSYREYLLENFKLQISNASGRQDSSDFTHEDQSVIIENATNRLFESHGLIGSPNSCLDRVKALEAIGVDEFACLIDFGPSPDDVLQGLDYLEQLKQLYKVGIDKS